MPKKKDEENLSIEDAIEGALNEQSPQGVAVDALINIGKRKPGETDSDVEIKTDLSEDEVRQHSALAVLNNVLEMSVKDFGSKSILGDLLNIKERKAISKNRKSREEIVNVARNPDQNTIVPQDNSDGALKRFFTSRKQ